MAKLIVIIGVTGQQGGAVAKTFLKEPGYRIRGVTRNPDKASNQILKDQGIELVAADLDDPESLRQAFANANVIFGVTDFWQFMKDPETQKTADSQGKTINEVSYDRELVQGKNIVDAAATNLATLDRFVLSTLSHTKKWSQGRIKHNYHFDGKAVFTEYMQTEYPELSKRSNLLHVGMYMSNWQGLIGKPKKQADGTFHIVHPGDPNKPCPWVHPPNDTGIFVRALLAEPAGTNLLGVSEEMSYIDFTATWSRVTGRQARFIQIPMDEWKATLPPTLAAEVGDSILAFNEFGWCGPDHTVVKPVDIGIGKHELTSVEQYMQEADWSSVL